MADISKVMGSFFTRPVNELKHLFKEQTNEWLEEFFNKATEKCIDSDAKFKWANRVIDVVPYTACRHITWQFLKQLGYSHFIPNLSECPLSKDLIDLSDALLHKLDITPILERIPYNHHSHGMNVFVIVFSNGTLDDISKLFNFYLAKIGPEKLHSHWLKTKILVALNREQIKLLISLYKQNGMDPVTFILPKDASTYPYSVLGVCSLEKCVVCLPEVPHDQLWAFVHQFGTQFISSKGCGISAIFESFERVGIPRSEFINRAILEFNNLPHIIVVDLFSCMNDEEKCALLFSPNFRIHPYKIVLDEIQRLEVRPDIMAKRFQTKKPEELRAFFRKQSNEWMYEFFSAVKKEPEHSIELLKSTIPPGTCRQVTGLLFETEETNEPECAVEEDLILLEAAIGDNCHRNIERLLNSIPLYHKTNGYDVFDIVFGDIPLMARLFDIHLNKTGPTKLNEFLRGKKVIRWHALPYSGKLIEDYTKKGLDLVSFMFEPDDLDSCVIDLLSSELHDVILPLIPKDRLIAHVKKYGEIIKFPYEKMNKEQSVQLAEELGLEFINFGNNKGQ